MVNALPVCLSRRNSSAAAGRGRASAQRSQCKECNGRGLLTPAAEEPMLGAMQSAAVARSAQGDRETGRCRRTATETTLNCQCSSYAECVPSVTPHNSWSRGNPEAERARGWSNAQARRLQDLDADGIEDADTVAHFPHKGASGRRAGPATLAGMGVEYPRIFRQSQSDRTSGRVGCPSPTAGHRASRW